MISWKEQYETCPHCGNPFARLLPYTPGQFDAVGFAFHVLKCRDARRALSEEELFDLREVRANEKYRLESLQLEAVKNDRGAQNTMIKFNGRYWARWVVYGQRLEGGPVSPPSKIRRIGEKTEEELRAEKRGRLRRRLNALREWSEE